MPPVLIVRAAQCMQIGKMYVESAPYLMDPVKLGAHLGESVNPRPSPRQRLGPV